MVLPSNIGAERIAELLLHQESARFIEGLERSHGFQRVLHNFGMELEVVTRSAAKPGGAHDRRPASSARRAMPSSSCRSTAAMASVFTRANRRTPWSAKATGVVLIGRPNRAAILTALFEPRERFGPRG